MDKPAVAVLFGGRSSEHSISSATAAGVLSEIDRERFEVIPVGVTRAGAFVLEDDDPAKFALRADRLPEVIDNGTRVLWPSAPGEARLRVEHPDGTIVELGRLDAVLPILHGAFGEDGAIQGFFETLDIPYAGGGVLDSALCMDKHFMKVALEHAGVPVAPWITLTRAEWDADSADMLRRADELGGPWFVKPARAGSSVGVSSAKTAAELPAAIEVALAEDDKVLVEQTVRGREVEVGVLAGPAGEGPRASLPGEIVLSGREFYDFEGKYLGGDGVQVVCPADLDAAAVAAVQSMAVRAFDAVGGKALARVDFFLTPDGTAVVNELNTMPGFTSISMFPLVWAASGLSYTDLISELIDGAIDAARSSGGTLRAAEAVHGER